MSRFALRWSRASLAPVCAGRAWALLRRTYPDVIAIVRSYRTSATPDPGLRVAVARCARFVRRMDRTKADWRV